MSYPNLITVPKLDPQKTCNCILGFIKGVVEETGAEGTVVGLSGGVDSSLTATLCVRSLGNERVLGLMMPTDFTPQRDLKDAERLVKWLKISNKLIDVQTLRESFFQALKLHLEEAGMRVAVANILARIRMTILYYHANLNSYLVVGTGDRSEILIGYFTKYGDGGADFLPIGHLYKTQVRQLAKQLGLPEGIADKPSSPQLYLGHRAIDEIPLPYRELDPVLIGLYDEELSLGEVSQLTGVPIGVVNDVRYRFDRSRHKRTYPPMLREG